MINDIVLTRYEETLQVSIERFDERIDEAELSRGFCNYIGVHKICKGFINFGQVSEKWGAVVCRLCGLRIMVPWKINTYRELSEYLDNLLKPPSDGELPEGVKKSFRELMIIPYKAHKGPF